MKPVHVWDNRWLSSKCEDRFFFNSSLNNTTQTSLSLESAFVLVYFILGYNRIVVNAFGSLKTAWRRLNDLFCPHFSPHVVVKVTRGVKRHFMMHIKIFRQLIECNLWFCDRVTCLLWASNESSKSNFFRWNQWSALSISSQVLHHCLVLVRREWSIVSLAVDRQERIFDQLFYWEYTDSRDANDRLQCVLHWPWNCQIVQLYGPFSEVECSWNDLLGSQQHQRGSKCLKMKKGKIQQLG